MSFSSPEDVEETERAWACQMMTYADDVTFPSGRVRRYHQMDKTMNKKPTKKPETTSDQAFDLWLKRGLHQLFDDVANEPIPEELLKLIEDDRGE